MLRHSVTEAIVKAWENRRPGSVTWGLGHAAAAVSYLPTEKAVMGGGYSAVVQSCTVGPEGGQILVDRTVELINSLWTGAR